MAKLLNAQLIEERLFKNLYGKRKEGQCFPHLLHMKLGPESKLYTLSKAMRGLLPEYDNVFKNDILLHQLYLGECRSFYSKRICHDQLFSEYELKIFAGLIQDRNADIEPDLSLESKGVRVAIELERTKKEKARYFSKFYDYYDSSYTHVLYVFMNQRTLSSVLGYTKIYRKIGFSLFDNLSEVYSPNYGKLSLEEWIGRISSIGKER